MGDMPASTDAVAPETTFATQSTVYRKPYVEDVEDEGEPVEKAVTEIRLRSCRVVIRNLHPNIGLGEVMKRITGGDVVSISLSRLRGEGIAVVEFKTAGIAESYAQACSSEWADDRMEMIAPKLEGIPLPKLLRRAQVEYYPQIPEQTIEFPQPVYIDTTIATRCLVLPNICIANLDFLWRDLGFHRDLSSRHFRSQIESIYMDYYRYDHMSRIVAGDIHILTTSMSMAAELLGRVSNQPAWSGLTYASDPCNNQHAVLEQPFRDHPGYQWQLCEDAEFSHIDFLFVKDHGILEAMLCDRAVFQRAIWAQCNAFLYHKVRKMQDICCGCRPAVTPTQTRAAFEHLDLRQMLILHTMKSEPASDPHRLPRGAPHFLQVDPEVTLSSSLSSLDTILLPSSSSLNSLHTTDPSSDSFLTEHGTVMEDALTANSTCKDLLAADDLDDTAAELLSFSPSSQGSLKNAEDARDSWEVEQGFWSVSLDEYKAMTLEQFEKFGSDEYESPAGHDSARFRI